MATAEGKTYSDLLTPIECDSCGEQDDVINYCLQCHGNLCDLCKTRHCNTRLTQNHIVLHRTHPEAVRARRSTKIYCSQHTGKEYVTYCVRCSKPCCATCIIETHDGHRFSDLEEMISKTESDVNKIVEDLETNLIPNTEKTVSSLDKRIDEYKKGLNVIQQSARERIHRIEEELKKAKEALFADMKKYGKEDLIIMEGKRLELNYYLDRLNSLTEKGKKAPVDVVTLLSLKEDLSKLEKGRPTHINCPKKLHFQESTFHFKPGYDFIGTVSKGEETISLDVSTEIQYEIAQKDNFKNVKGVKVVRTIDKVNVQTLLCYYSDQLWIFDCYTQNICIYDSSLSRIQTISPGFFITDMAMYASNAVIASDQSKRRIVKISSSGEIKTFFCTSPYTPHAICVSNDRHSIVVGVSYKVRILIFRGKILIYSCDDFSVLREINDSESGLSLQSIDRIIHLVSGEYLMCATDTLICYSQEWEFLWSRHFKNLRTLLCDKYNNILIGIGYCIQLINKEGCCIRTIYMPNNFISPIRSIALDNKERLWIGLAEGLEIALLNKCGSE